ncbi:hypothetical protein CTI12_AA423570 [Artemisia annua]|uniref:Uncharacterized protein n=1 Tax=Artemisia annua TaxID=35608 RepID=A0A2U1M341_ARTAN|nr:hypothetical protein CTI12_AA423570 [Artemisia annua]
MELKVLHDRTFLLWSIFPPPVFLSLFLGSETTTQPQDTETDMQHQSAKESTQPQNARAATQDMRHPDIAEGENFDGVGSDKDDLRDKDDSENVKALV